MCRVSTDRAARLFFPSASVARSFFFFSFSSVEGLFPGGFLLLPPLLYHIKGSGVRPLFFFFLSLPFFSSLFAAQQERVNRLHFSSFSPWSRRACMAEKGAGATSPSFPVACVSPFFFFLDSEGNIHVAVVSIFFRPRNTVGRMMVGLC